MALSVCMGAFLLDPLMGLPTCARRCFKVFFGHAMLPRKLCAGKSAVCQARQSLSRLALGNRTTLASVPPCLGLADSSGKRRPRVFTASNREVDAGGAHFVLQNPTNIFAQAKGAH